MNESVVTIFGTDLQDAVNKVLSASTLFSAHREHQLFRMSPVSSLESFDRGRMVSKSDADLRTLLISVHAQLLYAVAQTFESRFKSVKKASPTMRAEVKRDFDAACVAETSNLRKHLLWLLRSMQATKLRNLMTSVMDKLPQLQMAAFGSIDLPCEVSAQLQDEIDGADKRRNGRGDAAGRKANLNLKPSPKKDENNPRGGKKQKPPTSLDQLLVGGGTSAAETPPNGLSTAQFASQLAASLHRLPDSDELRTAKLASETERADREQQRADREQQRADREQQRADREQQRADTLQGLTDGLRSDLATLRTSSDASSVASSSTPEKDSAQVRQLESEIAFLRKQVIGLTLLMGGDKNAAAGVFNEYMGT